MRHFKHIKIGTAVKVNFYDHSFHSQGSHGLLSMTVRGVLMFVGENYIHVDVFPGEDAVPTDGYSIHTATIKTIKRIA